MNCDMLYEVSNVLSEPDAIYTMVHIYYIHPLIVKKRETVCETLIADQHERLQKMEQECSWRLFGELHRDDGPAYINFSRIGGAYVMDRCEWFQHGLPGRLGKGYSYWTKHGEIVYYEHGEICRGGGLPAVYGSNYVLYYTDGRLTRSPPTCMGRTQYGRVGCKELAYLDSILETCSGNTDLFDKHLERWPRL